MAYSRGLQTLKSQSKTILGLLRQTVPVTMTQFLLCGPRAAENGQPFVNEWAWLCSNKALLTHEVVSQIWPQTIVCQHLACRVKLRWLQRLFQSCHSTLLHPHLSMFLHPPRSQCVEHAHLGALSPLNLLSLLSEALRFKRSKCNPFTELSLCPKEGLP